MNFDVPTQLIANNQPGYFEQHDVHVTIIAKNSMIYGDPHVTMYDGTTFTLPPEEGVYRYYQGQDLTIDIETRKIPELREAIYIKKVFILSCRS